jgi:protein tyrosine/serine phosphatase
MILFLFALLFAASPTQAQNVSAAELPHFSQVSEGIFRGARPSLQNFPLLTNYKVKTVIDLQGGDAKLPIFGWVMDDFEPGEKPSMIAKERRLSHQLGMQFVNYPLSSIKNVDAKEDLWIREALTVMSDPLNQPVFIHCEHGNDRTGLIIALYRVFVQGWSANEAHAEMMEMGHGSLGSQILTGAMDRYFRKVTKGY